MNWESEAKKLRSLIDVPRTDDFFESVKLEAAHQIDRWGSQTDAGKTDADWYWLIGYIAGKVLCGAPSNLPSAQAKSHRIIAIAAVCLNWWRATNCLNNSMRPGIAPPEGEGGAK